MFWNLDGLTVCIDKIFQIIVKYVFNLLQTSKVTLKKLITGWSWMVVNANISLSFVADIKLTEKVGLQLYITCNYLCYKTLTYFITQCNFLVITYNLQVILIIVDSSLLNILRPSHNLHC